MDFPVDGANPRPDPGMKDPETHAIIGAALEVHRQLGPGFLEAVYQQALALELSELGIAFRREVDLPVHYKGHLLACEYRADFVCFGRVVLELKAVPQMVSGHRAQLINELKATGSSLGLLLNFGAASLEFLRFVRSEKKELAADFADFRRLGEEEGGYVVSRD